MNILILITRTFVLTSVILNLVIWGYIYFKNKKYRNYALAPFLFSIHALIFVTLGAFDLLSREVYIIWRDLVSLHGVIIMISAGSLLIKLGGKK
jgi:hypothetical protein